MPSSIDTSVLIVGGGPVGLTLALDLASRGIDVTVTEVRRAGELPSVKCNQVSSRSMEVYRRLGIAKTIRAAGLPADHPHDVACRISATGLELSRITLPSPAGRGRGEPGDDTWWPTPEATHRINQTYLRFIEENNYRDMPAAVYLRGFLVQMARFHKLENPDQIAADYMAIMEKRKKESS